jgi:uncharacterized DUF497 family protein
LAYYHFIWTDEAIDHIAEHDLSPEDVEAVISAPEDETVSRSSGRAIAFGYTADGRYIAALFDMVDDITVIPVTAYEVPEPQF